MRTLCGFTRKRNQENKLSRIQGKETHRYPSSARDVDNRRKSEFQRHTAKSRRGEKQGFCVHTAQRSDCLTKHDVTPIHFMESWQPPRGGRGHPLIATNVKMGATGKVAAEGHADAGPGVQTHSCPWTVHGPDTAIRKNH